MPLGKFAVAERIGQKRERQLRWTRTSITPGKARGTVRTNFEIQRQFTSSRLVCGTFGCDVLAPHDASNILSLFTMIDALRNYCQIRSTGVLRW